MADRTFSINIKPETIESIMLEPDKELMRDIPTSEKLIYELQEQELYKGVVVIDGLLEVVFRDTG
ncbi:MAG: hypothetical protein P8Z31_08665 [Gammaproteobacteria bacterium]